MSFTPLFGQMILTEEDAGLNTRAGKNSTDISVIVPLQNTNVDQYEENYIPVGNGLLLLAGLGGTYLLKKKRSKK